MQYTINQLDEHVCQKVNTIYETFKSFFGNEYVDLHERTDRSDRQHLIKSILGCYYIQVDDDYDTPYTINESILRKIEDTFSEMNAFIYVWWPQVTVTNEYDKSVEIQDLYAKIEIQFDGTIPYECVGFLLNRATYTKEQFLCNYMHSHIQKIPKEDLSTFMPPCLGTGPIRGTIATLKNNYDNVMWMLFCEELSMYVTIESLIGGPWNKLENIGNKVKSYSYLGYNLNSFTVPSCGYLTPDVIKNFTFYYLQRGHLSLSYKDGHFICGMPYYEYIIDISNAFIDFYNRFLKTTKNRLDSYFSKGVLNKVLIANGNFYNIGDSDIDSDIEHYQGNHVLCFKGKDITITITDLTKNNPTLSTVISHGLAMYILRNILRTINYRFKNGHNERYSREHTPSTSKGAIYL